MSILYTKGSFLPSLLFLDLWSLLYCFQNLVLLFRLIFFLDQTFFCCSALSSFCNNSLGCVHFDTYCLVYFGYFILKFSKISPFHLDFVTIALVASVLILVTNSFSYFDIFKWLSCFCITGIWCGCYCQPWAICSRLGNIP